MKHGDRVKVTGRDGVYVFLKEVQGTATLRSPTILPPERERRRYRSRGLCTFECTLAPRTSRELGGKNARGSRARRGFHLPQ